MFGGFRSTREFFTHMETTSLPVKDCKYWLILSTQGHWAVRVLKRASLTVTRDIRFYSYLRHETYTDCRVFSSGAVTICFNVFGPSRKRIEHPTFRIRFLTNRATAASNSISRYIWYMYIPIHVLWCSTEVVHTYTYRSAYI